MMRFVPSRRAALRGGLYAAGAVLAAVLVLGSYLYWLDRTGNFAVVVPGEAYRSAQVTPKAIRRYKAQHGIASILNLRRPDPDSAWYRDELATSADLGIAHADFPMSSGHMLPQDQARALIALMAGMPKPILIHCDQGANRTGLASALYLAAIKHAPEAVSEAQLSIRYGHLALPWPVNVSPMYATFEALEAPLGIEDEIGRS